MNTCKNCGETLGDDSNFCPNCGVMVHSMERQRPEDMTKAELLKLLAEKDEEIAKEKEEKKRILEGVGYYG